eukprot:scaffold357871_cov33-Prasinocladus_malaysianus.AAC.1
MTPNLLTAISEFHTPHFGASSGCGWDDPGQAHNGSTLPPQFSSRDCESPDGRRFVNNRSKRRKHILPNKLALSPLYVCIKHYIK